MPDSLPSDPGALSVGTYLLTLTLAAAVGAALGLVRPPGNALLTRPVRIVQAQILLAVVGALIIMVVAESLARAFAVVGAAGLIHYRAPIRDPKDAGVMLVALALGLTVGSQMFLLAGVACLFVIAILWVLETFEPATPAQFEVVVGGKEAAGLRPEIERALEGAHVPWELLGSSSRRLHYATRVPLQEGHIRELAKTMRELGEHSGRPLKWKIKKMKPLTL